MDIRINELDLTRAGIVSVQRDMPAENTNWEVEYTIDGVAYRVIGNALYGRPHGTDADVLLALQTLFFRAGCPENNRIEVLPAAVLELSGSSKGGAAYARLRESILRISGVQWSIVRSRWDSKKGLHRGVTEITGLVSDLRLVDHSSGQTRPFQDREMSESVPIRLTFTETFAASIRAGFFQMLDGELMARFGQPPARSLYRILQAHRIQQDGSLVNSLSLPLRDWLAACGLESERVDNAKRTLDLSHHRLIDEGYLHSAEIIGRGRAGQVQYVFQAAPEPELVELLMARGVTRPVAEALAADHPTRIWPALQTIDQRLGGGWRPRSLAAAVVDAVRNPDKWGFAATEPPKQPVKKAAKLPVSPPMPEPDLRASVTMLLKVRLTPGQPLSAQVTSALTGLPDERLPLLRDALSRPGTEALPLAAALLGISL
ncbi:plasmid replication initiator protein [Deinococcus sp. Arct2-2]|uniref:replication initiator protein A n=1 Tax=Deinococcus sp. Arct2-2 TaxID=2568653 RepID=UPI0010A2F34E|nr:replication initiator protein A [Deinococcus sp. Arct2-2]THF69837.1 plasmid replication initiator protein [Deinococcus sp. Arct2-2]